MTTQAEIEAAAKAYRECNSTDLEKMKAVLEAAERVRWQPIETAPKDGMPIWLGTTDRVFISPHASDHTRATHWQPLPSPPETK